MPTVRVSFKGQEVSGLSIMGLMMLAAGIGSEIELTCSGRQAVEAMAALSALVEGKFGEELILRKCDREGARRARGASLRRGRPRGAPVGTT